VLEWDDQERGKGEILRKDDRMAYLKEGLQTVITTNTALHDYGLHQILLWSLQFCSY
jgi:hypothetical protein